MGNQMPSIEAHRQYNGQNKKDKRTNNNLQNTTQSTKDRGTRIPQKTFTRLLGMIIWTSVYLLMIFTLVIP